MVIFWACCVSDVFCVGVCVSFVCMAVCVCVCVCVFVLFVLCDLKFVCWYLRDGTPWWIRKSAKGNVDLVIGNNGSVSKTTTATDWTIMTGQQPIRGQKMGEPNCFLIGTQPIRAKEFFLWKSNFIKSINLYYVIINISFTPCSHSMNSEQFMNNIVYVHTCFFRLWFRLSYSSPPAAGPLRILPQK